MGTAPARRGTICQAFGDRNSVFRRVRRRSAKGVWQRIFAAMSDDPAFASLIVDATSVRAQRQQSWRSMRAAIAPR